MVINEWVSDETLQTVSLLVLLMVSIDEWMNHTSLFSSFHRRRKKEIDWLMLELKCTCGIEAAAEGDSQPQILARFVILSFVWMESI
jgi:hypothetical protein